MLEPLLFQQSILYINIKPLFPVSQSERSFTDDSYKDNIQPEKSGPKPVKHTKRRVRLHNQIKSKA